MGVTFTTFMGFAKPDSNDLAENWVSGTGSPDYNGDNNTILLNNVPYLYQSYTPTLIGATTAPSVGAGTQQGQYADILGFIRGQVRLIFTDPGVLAGSGEWGIKLPVPVDPVYHTVGNGLVDTAGSIVGQNSCIGEGYLHDASTPANCSTCAVDCVTIAGVSYARLIIEGIGTKTNRVFASSSPFTVVTTDAISFNFFYRKQ